MIKPKEKIICLYCGEEKIDNTLICNFCSTPFDIETENSTQTKKVKNIVSDRYKILDEIGNSVNGIVYKTFDMKLESIVMLKKLILHPDLKSGGSEFKSLLNEIQGFTKLNHPNIAKVLDVGFEDDFVYIVTEYIEGLPLSGIMTTHGISDLKRVIDYAIQICDGIGYAHSMSIIHKDLEPSNIFLINNKTIKITNFGIPKMIKENQNFDNIEESYLYLTPEGIKGVDNDIRSDIFSIGVILYELVMGKKLFTGSTREEIIHNILHIEPVDLDKSDNQSVVPLKKIIKKALAKDPGNRFQNIEILKKELVEISNSSIAIRQERQKKQIIWNIAYPRNNKFTGRSKTYKRIAEEFSSIKTDPVKLVLHGQDGVGKTQIAYEYIYKNMNEYSIIWWIKAGCTSTLKADFFAIAEALKLPIKGLKDDEIIEIVKQGLTNIKNWLLIFDNTENPEELSRFFPKKGTGHILITSRNPHWRGLAKSIRVKKFRRKESIEYICKWTKKAINQVNREFVEAIDNFPLALTYACSYIKTTDEHPIAYLDLFLEHQRELHKLDKPISDSPEYIYITFEIALCRLKMMLNNTVELLNLLSFLAPNNIPIKLLCKGSKFLPENLDTILEDPFKLDEIIATIKKFSFIEKRNDYISMHELLQKIIRDELDLEERKRWLETTLHLINEAFYFDENDSNTWLECAILLPHAFAATRHADDCGIALDIQADLLNTMGLYLWHQGSYNDAKHVVKKACEIGEKVLGPEHPQLAEYINNLGTILRSLGEFEDATFQFERSFKINKIAFGPDHPKVIRDLNNLGAVLARLGFLDKAKEHLELSLSIAKKIHGEDRQKVTSFLNNLGIVNLELGDTNAALALFEHALRIDQKEYGVNNPRLSLRLSNIGDVYLERNEILKAKSYFDNAFAIDLKIYGPDHPNIASALNNLGKLYTDLGDYEEAMQDHRKALDIYSRAFGPEHLDVANTLSLIAALFFKSGNLDETENLITRAFEIHKQYYGFHHPAIANDLYYLGLAMAKSKNKRKAKNFLIRSHKIYLEIYGPDHELTKKVETTISNFRTRVKKN
jgi:serine/threonine protein kinase/tetratricopeptide (TPR) repeat protein